MDSRKKITFHFIFGFIPIFIIFLIGLEKLKLFVPQGSISKFIPIEYICIILYATLFYLYYLSLLHQKRKTLQNLQGYFIACLLFLPIVSIGPFFQPPSDPVFHADFLWEFKVFGTTTFELPNKEFITKSLFDFFYNFIDESNLFSRLGIIYHIHIVNSFIMISSVYFSSIGLGISGKWSLASVAVMLFFFGTNRFSYLTYYSLAPGSINLSFYWICTSLILNAFFKAKINNMKSVYYFFYLCTLVILLLPILFLNHNQEAGYFLFFYFLIFTLLIIKLLLNSKLKSIYKVFGFVMIFFALFLPFPLLKYIHVPFSERVGSLVLGNPIYYYNVKKFLFFGKINGPRIIDTLAFAGFFPILITLFFLYKYFSSNGSRNNREALKFIIPGLLPFWIILVPINFMIWTAAIPTPEVFYRLCYTSQFWISIAYLLSSVEVFYIIRIKSFLRYLGIA